MNVRLSLVMATLGRTAEIDRCVDSLAAQTCRDFELIVVDQNPDDRLVPVLARARALGLECRHLRQSEPNQCLARNTGVEASRGGIVAFPDDDCWYEPDVVERVLTRFEEQHGLDGLVIQWAEQLAANKPSEPRRFSFSEFARMRGPTASCITLFFGRSILREVGNFDLALGLHSWYGAGEETDLFLRILYADAVVEFDPTIHVHHPLATPTSLPPARMFAGTRRRARGTGALYARHPLPVWVIVRGLLSPWAKALLNAFKPREAAQKLGLAIGRLEGYVGWLLGYRAGRKRGAP
ncbi:MAG: glycosyltransferase family 2 protein [Thiobacillus sp.]|nr:glycosyltransferase family 2 protein [Thiobacillus sp.]